MKRRARIGVAALAVLVAGCAGPGPGGSSPHGTSSPHARSGPHARSDPRTARKSCETRPRLTSERVVAGGPGTTDLALGPAGEILQEVGTRLDSSAQGAGALHPGVLRILDPRTGQARTIRDRAHTHDHTQTPFAALDSTHAAWIEVPGTSLQDIDWRLYSADRRTGAISLVARAHPVDRAGSTPTVPGFTVPTLARGRVFWAEARAGAGDSGAPTVNVYSRPLDPGSAGSTNRPARLEARDAFRPYATGSALYYAAFHRGRSTSAYAVYRKSLVTGRTSLVARGSGGAQGSLAAYGDTVAWVVGPHTVEVFRGERRIARLSGGSGSGGSASGSGSDGRVEPDYLTAGPDAIGFGDASDSGPGGNYLLDLRTGCLHDLGDAPGLAGLMLAGRTVMWAMSGGSGADQHRVWHHATLG